MLILQYGRTHRACLLVFFFVLFSLVWPKCRTGRAERILPRKQISLGRKEICVEHASRSTREDSIILFKITLLILFIIGLIRLIRGDFGW